jgi:endonuclease G
MMTAVNIDGKNLKDIDRKTGSVSDAESLAVTDEAGPEAREKWYDDPRIDPADIGNDALYTDQVVSAGRNRTGRIFHRGHMVRRLDPCWGSKASALRAEADTFHFANCTPQVGMFNSGQTLWQGIENHVLDNARVQDLRVCVFTGPILEDDDPKYRNDVFPGFRVPRKFFKIVVWSDGGSLSALAMVADQSGVLREMPERAEDMDDTAAVEDFVSTVASVERHTGLDFGALVRNADLYEDASERAGSKGVLKRLRALSELRLERSTKRRIPKSRSAFPARSLAAKPRR